VLEEEVVVVLGGWNWFRIVSSGMLGVRRAETSGPV
jgi:hypothetical protein